MNKVLHAFKTLFTNPKQAIIHLLWVNGSYSQTWEDLILYHMIWDIKGGTYLDIWANEPIKLNNTYYFYKKWWRWINIEPNRKLLNEFKRKRPWDINLNIAIWNWDTDKIMFYEFDPHTLSTCDEETAKKYVKMWHKNVAKYDVEMLTLTQILDKYSPEKQIDILSIDVEWYDLEILKSNDWSKYHPTYIILETVEYNRNHTWKKLNDIYNPILEKYWYNEVAETWINTIYKYKK